MHNTYSEQFDCVNEFDVSALVTRIIQGEGTSTIAECMGLGNEDVDDFSKILIEEMQLSGRAYNCLKRTGIHDLAGILRCTANAFRKIRNLGKKSMEEILCVSHHILLECDRGIHTESAAHSADSLKSDFSVRENMIVDENGILNCKHLRFLHDIVSKCEPLLSGKEHKQCLMEMLQLWCDMEAPSEEIKAFENVFCSQIHEQMLQKQIMNAISETNYYGLTIDEIAEKFVDAAHGVDLSAMLDGMQSDGMLRCIKGRFVPNCMTLQEWLDQNLKDDRRVFLIKRLQGATLQQVAEEMGGYTRTCAPDMRKTA